MNPAHLVFLEGGANLQTLDSVLLCLSASLDLCSLVLLRLLLFSLLSIGSLKSNLALVFVPLLLFLPTARGDQLVFFFKLLVGGVVGPHVFTFFLK